MPASLTQLSPISDASCRHPQAIAIGAVGRNLALCDGVCLKSFVTG